MKLVDTRFFIKTAVQACIAYTGQKCWPKFQLMAQTSGMTTILPAKLFWTVFVLFAEMKRGQQERKEDSRSQWSLERASLLRTFRPVPTHPFSAQRLLAALLGQVQPQQVELDQRNLRSWVPLVKVRPTVLDEQFTSLFNA